MELQYKLFITANAFKKIKPKYRNKNLGSDPVGDVQLRPTTCNNHGP